MKTTKKLLFIIPAIIIFSVLFIIGASAQGGVKAECILGDTDADGYITVADARLVLRSAIGIEPIADINLPLYDTDGDRAATVADARLVLRVAIGLDKPFTHREVADGGVEATCLRDGLTPGSHCEVCGKTVKISEKIPAVEHSFKATEVVKPTCARDGYTVYTCEYNCGTTKNGDTVPATAHSWDKGLILTPADCTNDGKAVYTCVICDASDTRTVPATGHTAVFCEEKPATCTEAGTTGGSYCEICKTVISGLDDIPAKGHTEVVTPAKQPTCTEFGYTEGISCSECGETLKGIYIVAATGHEEEVVKGTEPTCTETGLTGGIRCAKCGEMISTQKVLPAKGHNWDNGTLSRLPECVTEGEMIFTCTVNGCDGYKAEKIPATGHKLKRTVYVAPTCENDGSDEYCTCSVCGRVYTNTAAIKETTVEDRVLPSLGHDYRPAVTKTATCTENGVITYTCTHDSAHSYTESVPATGHTRVTREAVPATCNDKGMTAYDYCDVCGTRLTIPGTIMPLGHDYDEGTITKAPTCTEAGYKRVSCKRCDDTTNIYLRPLGHDYDEDVTEVTCTTDGYTIFTCKVCGDTYRGNELKATGHNPVYKPVDGFKHRLECEGCGEIYSEDEECEFTELRTDADCIHPGTRTYGCVDCGRQITVPVTVPLGHTPGEEVTENRVEPTCTKEGSYEIAVYCTVCEKELSRQTVTLEAKGHAPGNPENEKTVPAKCEENGSYDEVIYCSVCHVELTRESKIIPATGHSAVTDYAVNPTCTKSGKTEGSHCRTCRKVLVAQETVPATGHTEKILPATEPTCMLGGWTEKTVCATCGITIKDSSYIPYLGHDEVKYPGKEPTCTEAGYTSSASCSRCGRVFSAKITLAATGHTPVTDEALEPTCTVDGRLPGTHCGKCGTVLSGSTVIPATGHTQELKTNGNGTHSTYCTVCNETLTTVNCTYTDEVTPATCVSDGYTTHTCTVCAYEYSDGTVAAFGHSTVTDEAYAPTCTQEGRTQGSHCETCGETIVAQEIIPATGHTTVIETGIPATCTEEGIADYIVCTVCHETLQDKVIIPAKGHDKRYTSNSDATHKVVCGVCEALLSEAESCTFEDETVAATCTAEGKTTPVCKYCSYRGEATAIPVISHTAGKTVKENDVKPTCTADGSFDEAVYCTVCHTEISRLTKTVPATGHREVTDKGHNPTCTQTGLTDGKHCTVCGEKTVKQEVIPATGHTMTEWENYYNEDGILSHRHECTVCGEKVDNVCILTARIGNDGKLILVCDECGYSVQIENKAEAKKKED